MPRDGRTTTAPQPHRSVKALYVKVMKALSDPTRLDMIRLIGSAAQYPCTSLEQELPVSKSTISYHVKILSEADLISVRRQGKHFFYALHADVLDYYTPSLIQRLAEDETTSN